MTEKTASAKTGTVATLSTPPSAKFFMTLRDIGMWVQSARADAELTRHAAVGDIAYAFEMLYRANPDPYAAVDPRYRYQARKYTTLLSFLPARHYGHVLDLGCGVGALCRALAPYAETITGVDVAPAAVEHAINLSQQERNIAFTVGDVRTFDAVGRRYDLVVIADVLYYALRLEERHALDAIARRVSACMAPGGLVLLTDHYFFGFDAASRRTRAIHDAFGGAAAFHHYAEHRRCFYLATLLQQLG